MRPVVRTHRHHALVCDAASAGADGRDSSPLRSSPTSDSLRTSATSASRRTPALARHGVLSGHCAPVHGGIESAVVCLFERPLIPSTTSFVPNLVPASVPAGSNDCIAATGCGEHTGSTLRMSCCSDFVIRTDHAAIERAPIATEQAGTCTSGVARFFRQSRRLHATQAARREIDQSR